MNTSRTADLFAFASPNTAITRSGYHHLGVLLILLGAFITCISQAQYSPPTSGLVSWWKANGNANDSADSNHGTLLNGSSYGAGLFGNSFALDGVNDHVRVPNSANLQFSSGLTLGAWINKPTLTGNHSAIMSKWDLVFGVNQRSFTFAVSPIGQVYMAISPGGFDPPIELAATSTNVISPGTWTHVAGSYDGSFIRIYINGQLNAQKAYTGGIFSGTDALGIGGVVGGAAVGAVGSPFGGRIDEAVIYDRALSGAEIITLSTVPEPSSCALILVGSLCVALSKRNL
jgi:hypothetical protein